MRLDARVLIDIFVNSAYYGQCEGSVALPFDPQVGDGIDFGASPQGASADALILRVESRVIYPSKTSPVAALLNMEHLILESDEQAIEVVRWLEGNFRLNFWRK